MSEANTLEILSPDRWVRIRSAAEPVLVRELSWVEQRRFLERVQEQVVGAMALTQGTADIKTTLRLVFESENMVEEVLAQTTSLTREQIGTLTISEVFGLLDVALELNVSALLAGAKKTFGRIGRYANNAAGNTTPIATS